MTLVFVAVTLEVQMVSIFTMGSTQSKTASKAQADQATPRDPCQEPDGPDVQHFDSYDDALRSAREQAGIGPDELTLRLYDPNTGTLVAEKYLDGKRGWRIDDGHVNGYDWGNGKRSQGGTNTHNCFPESQNGPQSPRPSEHDPDDWIHYDPPTSTPIDPNSPTTPN